MEVTQDHLAKQAARWARFARRHRAAFDVERKAIEATRFSARHRTHGLALPSKLVGTARCQEALRMLREEEYPVLRPFIRQGGYRDGRIALRYEVGHGPTATRLLLGYVQDKHLPWLRPLLASDALTVHALRVTGGTEEKPTLGCNIVIGGLDAALAEVTGRKPYAPVQPTMQRPPRTWGDAHREAAALFG